MKKKNDKDDKKKTKFHNKNVVWSNNTLAIAIESYELSFLRGR